MVNASAVWGADAERGAPGRIIFGRGTFERAVALTLEFGARILVVAGDQSAKSSGALDALLAPLLPKANVELFHNVGEPAIDMIDALAADAREFKPDVVLALGGGSVLDAGKAVASLLTNAAQGDSVRDFLEGVGTGRKITKPSMPLIAIPTTAGTGSEATKNSVIRDDDHTFKKSMRSPHMRPAVAIVDPALTDTCPPGVTAACGADALTQCIEAYTSARAGSFTDGWASEGIRLCSFGLLRTYQNPFDAEARDAMALASVLGGLALDNAGLGAVHGFASPLGAFFEIPHGVVCGNLLPETTEANLRWARAHPIPRTETLKRYSHISEWMTGTEDVGALIEFLKELRTNLQLPSFQEFGISGQDIDRIVQSSRGGSMKTNPVELSDEILTEILGQVMSR